MKFDSLVPGLWATDIEATIAFYRGLQWFGCLHPTEEWAILHNAYGPFGKIQFTGSFYFNSDDVEELWQRKVCDAFAARACRPF